MSQKLSDQITQYLIEHDYITRADLTTALEYQTRLSNSSQTNIEDILVDMEYITEETLGKAQRASSGNLNTTQDRQDPQSAAAYYAAGYATQSESPIQAAPTHPEQSVPPAMPSRPTQPQQPQAAAPVEASVRPEFEQMLADLGLTNSNDSESKEQASHPKLGEYLLENQIIADWQLMHAQCMLRDDPTVTRLDHLMVNLGYVSQDVVSQALQTLHNS